MTTADQHGSAQSSGQDDMFGLENNINASRSKSKESPWSERRRLEEEKKSLGLYLSGHPIQYYQFELSQVVDGNIINIEPRPERIVTIAGLVTSLRTYNTKRGDPMAFISLDDHTGRADVSIFGDLFVQTRKLLQSEGLLIVIGTCGVDERTGDLQVRANHIHSIESLRTRALTKIAISLKPDMDRDDVLSRLSELLSHVKGSETNIEIEYENEAGDVASIDLGKQWAIKVSDVLVEELFRLFGKQNINLLYDRSRLSVAPQSGQEQAA
jgi:DNA polymerase-3 subunit alpha